MKNPGTRLLIPFTLLLLFLAACNDNNSNNISNTNAAEPKTAGVKTAVKPEPDAQVALTSAARWALPAPRTSTARIVSGSSP